MNLCSEKHDEICFEGRKCPLCEAMIEIECLKDECDKREEEIDILKDEITNLNSASK